jgi:hypothetical protein
VAVKPALNSGFHHAFVVGAAFAFVGAIASAVLIPRVRPAQVAARTAEPQAAEVEQIGAGAEA